MFGWNFGKQFSIHFPWSSGLGTLGFKVCGHYVDFCISRGALRMFTALERNGVYEKFCFTVRSWYKLTRDGWQLLKREDFWGTWQHGKRRPPLYDLPDSGTTVDRAWELRQYFKPYQIIDWYGRTLEVISFPSPEKLSVTVMLREPNDPTTMFEETLEQFMPGIGPVPSNRRSS